MRVVGIRPIRLIASKDKKAVFKGGSIEHPYWQESGWRKVGDEYRGKFVTDEGAWRGNIKEHFFGSCSFFIMDPPDALRRSGHWPCFTNKGKGKYLIHFSRKPKDISSGIMTVEQLISESFMKERRRENAVSEKHEAQEAN